MKSFGANHRPFLGTFLSLLLVTQGCVTPTKTRTVSSALPRPGAKVVAGTVTNQTGQQFKFDVESELRTALVKQLESRALLASSSPAAGDLLLNLSITEYRPGSPFKRWALPGWGATVLAVKGGLWELDGRKLLAEIEHQRTVAAGGFYTVGAEHHILSDVARDLAADLQVRISKGGDFVVQAKSRADVVAAAGLGPDARTVWLGGVNDRRAEPSRIGERHAAFGVSMGDVYFSREVAGYLRENLELELTAAGCRLSDTNAEVSLTCDVNKFWLHTKTTALYWDVIADISIVVSSSNQAPPKREEYSATASKRTYVWPSATLCGQVIEECMDRLMKQFREAKLWR
jgi:uncharacterized lipoprotein YajG